MNHRMFRVATALAALVAGVAAAPAQAADVGVSIGISQPGVYGRIDIGRFPQPQVVVPRPVIIGRPAARAPEPVYLWVPPGHQKNWRRHCGAYNACGVPVYFVQDRWYRSQGPGRDWDGGRHGERGGHHEGGRRDHGRGHGEGHGG